MVLRRASLSLFVMTVASAVAYAQAPGARNVGTADFNGDGYVDILWDTHDELSVWTLEGLTVTGMVPTEPTTAGDGLWQVRGTGDFNGDGKVDILWQHKVAGQLVVWFMDAQYKMTTGEFIDTSDLSDVKWRVKATGDFNADGKADLLWQHDLSGQLAVWFMDGLGRTGGTLTSPDTEGDPDWVATATGDFDRDGRVDILWRQKVSGQIAIWYMNGTVRRERTFTTPSAELPEWVLAGTGDFDRDGNVDIIWQGPSDPIVAPTGQNVVWLMSNANLKPEGRVVVTP